MADGFLAKAADAQRNNRPRDAVSLYRAAVQADPAYFDAELSLGAAAMNLGDLALSLRAYELALAVKPDSFSTRFVFALGLKRAGYLQDSAEEFEKLLNQYSAGQAPERLAAVHLALANLYADQFHQTARARAHYLKVLELDPHNSQETAIRYWLQDNS
jgi:tetratricopeptide (TPR) repeat protein